MSFKSLAKVRRRKPEELKTLLSENTHESITAGQKLLAEAKEYGVPLRTFLSIAIDPRQAEQPEQYSDGKKLVGGYEAALQTLSLPVRDSFDDGVTLDLASDTFQTFPGTRAMFPEVIDDILRWNYRQDQFEKTSDLVANSRTINGTELLSTVVDDKADDYQVVGPVAEMSRVKVKSIRTTQQSVAFYKHGWGIRTSYEFARRARLDLLTPYANRVARETEMSKVGSATAILINGDGAYGAAPVVAQSSFNTAVGTNATNGKLSYLHLLNWLVDRAKAGTPVDTVVGNWNAYIQWLMMFAVPTSNNTRTDAENLAASGFKIGGVPLINGVVNFALSSTMTDNELLGMAKGETLEELIEAGSTIDESERSIVNQVITYVRTQNAGYRLAFGDTRSIYNFGG
jgi:hypothetical protein